MDKKGGETVLSHGMRKQQWRRHCSAQVPHKMGASLHSRTGRIPIHSYAGPTYTARGWIPSCHLPSLILTAGGEPSYHTHRRRETHLKQTSATFLVARSSASTYPRHRCLPSMIKDHAQARQIHKWRRDYLPCDPFCPGHHSLMLPAFPFSSSLTSAQSPHQD